MSERLCIIHHKLLDIRKMGGSEAVLFALLDQASCEFDVTLVSSGAVYVRNNIREIDQIYGTSISEKNIEFIEVPVDTWDRRPFGLKSYSVRQILFNLQINKIDLSDFHLVVSTTNDLFLKVKSLCYVHYPILKTKQVGNLKSRAMSLLIKVALFITRLTRFRRNVTYVTNSFWTKGQIEQSTGISAFVLNPPVSVGDCNESEFPKHYKRRRICIASRISREKNIDKILAQLDPWASENNYQISIAGPLSDEEYYNELTKKYACTGHITFTGMLSRAHYLELLSMSEIYLHGMKEEHFGITVAEAMLLGCIPVVHNSGGQIEITALPSLVYNDYSDIRKVLDNIIAEKLYVKDILKIRADIMRKTLNRKYFWQSILNIATK